ncbi:nitrile hydratase subunit alpha [Mesorhizobium sp. M8A.F.Ca.ET.173.01.1.1]|nr:nitrile hydratase subunit alpha [Mesorhizobium sp. M8A.F.Ca.ET.173.01.1.1]
MSQDHTHHHHDHDHDHDHTDVPDEPTLRIRAIESLLVEKGIIDTASVDEMIEIFENKLGPRNGARVVARAWSDPAYKERLLSNGTATIAELGFSGIQGEDMMVLENTDEVHNVVVCTLCSCYPWPTLGLPPSWYKSYAYRSRVVREPRTVLAEFGLTVSSETEVRVWDSNAEIRYLVLPQRPAGTEGWTEAQLAEIVSRDSMIGTGVVKIG